MNTFTYLIVLMGAATVALSGYVSLKFFIKRRRMVGDGKKLTGALAFMLLGEMLLGLGTLCFAIAAHSGHLPAIPLVSQSALRLFMFGSASLTTLHLFFVIMRIEDEG